MIISNVSRHTIGQLHQQLAAQGVNQDRELRSNGDCGIKLKKEGERGFGFGRAAHRAAAWSRFEVVIRNTFAKGGADTDRSALTLAKRITADLRAEAGPQQRLRLRQVADVAAFAGKFKEPAGNAAAALCEWPHRHEVHEPARVLATLQVPPRETITTRTPISPEAALIAEVCGRTIGDEPDPRASQKAIAAGLPEAHVLRSPAGVGHPRLVGPHSARAPRGPLSPEAELILKWCDEIPVRRDSAPTIVHPVRPVRQTVQVPAPTAGIRPAALQPPRDARAPTIVRAAPASVPVLAAHRHGEPSRAEMPSADDVPASPQRVEALPPEQLSVVLNALYEDPDWDPADSQGFQKVWDSYSAKAASARAC